MVSLTQTLVSTPVLWLAGSALAAQGQVWTVASAGGDFTTIQAAIDAASNGDTIVVSAGLHAGFTIDAKSLTITAAAGATPLLSSSSSVAFAVQNLGPAQSVTIRGIDTAYGAKLLNNQGSIWLEDLDLGNTFVFPFGLPALIGLETNGCDSVVITRCTLESNGPWSGGDGNPGLRAVNSSVHLFESTARGADQGQGAFLGDGLTRGGSGAEATGSFLVAHGSTFTGGIGADGGFCSPGGPGGFGLIAGAGSEIWLLDTTLTAGGGGCPTDYPFCSFCGPSGEPSLDLGGSIDLLSGHGRDYTLSSPVEDGQMFDLDFAGVPGDLVFSLVSLGQATSFQPMLGGTLVLPIPPIILQHGPVDPATGVLPTVTIPAPALPPGIGLTVYAQGAAITSVGAAVLCAPSQLTIL